MVYLAPLDTLDIVVHQPPPPCYYANAHSERYVRLKRMVRLLFKANPRGGGVKIANALIADPFRGWTEPSEPVKRVPKNDLTIKIVVTERPVRRKNAREAAPPPHPAAGRRPPRRPV